MRARKHRVSIGVASLLLALLLAPLLLQSHIHAASDTVAHPCATCAIGHQAPITPSTTISLQAGLAPEVAPAPPVRTVARRRPSSALRPSKLRHTLGVRATPRAVAVSPTPNSGGAIDPWPINASESSW